MKKITIILLVLTLVIALTACSSAELADIYNEEDVIAKAKQTVEVINSLDYDAINKELREDLQDQLDAATLKNSWDEKLTEAGTFKEYKSAVTIGQKSKSTGEDYATAILTCDYENSTLMFTIVLDEDLEVVGMYLK